MQSNLETQHWYHFVKTVLGIGADSKHCKLFVLMLLVELDCGIALSSVDI